MCVESITYSWESIFCCLHRPPPAVNTLLWYYTTSNCTAAASARAIPSEAMGTKAGDLQPSVSDLTPGELVNELLRIVI